MVDVCFYFQVHQPERIRNYQVFDIGHRSDYFDDHKNRAIIERASQKCYLPANRLMLELISQHGGKFKISYSLTGVWLDQAEKFAPEVIESFEKLNETGCVEFLSETYHHSLSYLYSKDEFREQVDLHRKKIRQLFGQAPKIFRNTELIYNNELANFIEGMGYQGIMAEGWDHYLGWRSPNFVYRPKTCKSIKLLLKNYKLSDDIAFRFSNHDWKEHPLTAPKYAGWINKVNGNGTNVNLFMDYETFGEHQWSTTGIFKFLKQLPGEILSHPDNGFVTPSELVARHEPKDEVDIHSFLSWADVERDLSAWIGNDMQNAALREIYAMEKRVKETGDERLIADWRKLLTSDHFVHKYFNPYDSPYEGFIAYMNVLNDISGRILGAMPRQQKSVPGTAAKMWANVALSENPSRIIGGQ